MSRPVTVAMDVDGTLAGADHRVSRRTSEIVRRLGRHGVTSIIVTGRTERSALQLARSLGLTAPVIAANGAVICDPLTGERLQVERFEPDLAARACALAEAHGCQPVFFTLDHPCAEQRTEYTDLLAMLLGEPVELMPLEQVIDQETIVKVMVAGAPEVLNEVEGALRAEIPGLERSLPQFCEAAPAGASKKEALAWVLTRLGVEPADCIGIGDADNDLAWLSSVGWAVAVANARPAVKEIADELIGRHDDDGVAEFLERRFLPG